MITEVSLETLEGPIVDLSRESSAGKHGLSDADVDFFVTTTAIKVNSVSKHSFTGNTWFVDRTKATGIAILDVRGNDHSEDNFGCFPQWRV